MLKRWLQDVLVFGYWLKRDAIRRWKLDTPLGIVGIIALILGLLLIVIIGQSFAAIFRAMVPWVSGTKISAVYWSSIGFGIKFGLVFLAFVVFVLLYFVIRLRK